MDLDALANASDHFAMFGLDRRFDLDEAALQSRYLELTRLTHPDFAGADEEAQLRAMQLSARVNEAHRILSDPEQRANYLLSLLGGPTREEDASLPPGFLNQLMDLREALDETQARGDHSAAAHITEQARSQREDHLKRIATLFAELSNAPPDADDDVRRQIRTQLNALRYVQRLLEQT